MLYGAQYAGYEPPGADASGATEHGLGNNMYDTQGQLTHGPQPAPRIAATEAIYTSIYDVASHNPASAKRQDVNVYSELQHDNPHSTTAAPKELSYASPDYVPFDQQAQ